MTVNILMPALSPTMTEGKLAKWHVKEGDEISSGDVIAEIETDKATMEVEAVEEGKIGKILVPEGTEGVEVNAVIAVLLEEDEDESALKDATAKAGPSAKPAETKESGKTPDGEAPAQVEKAKPASKESVGHEKKHDGEKGTRIFASPLARRLATEANLDLSAIKGSGPHGRIVKADIEAAGAGALQVKAEATELARRMAAQAGLDLSKIKGTGPGGRIERQDVEAVLGKAPTAAAAAPATSGPGAKALADMLGMAYRQEPLSGMRKTIARRLTESKQQVPHFYLTVDCRIDKLLAARKELNSRFEDIKVSVNDFVIKASALALTKVPAANASYDESGLIFYEHADVSVAVATPSGLITPIIKKAEGKGLSIISKEMKDLAARARDGKLKPEEYQGGTFSVSNLGMFGIRDFAAVINPPQGCILAVGAGEQRPVVKEGALAVATVMTCTLSVDHRVVDGAVGAEFLQAFKAFIEDPLTMLL